MKHKAPRILVVDDEPDMLRVCGDVLRAGLRTSQHPPHLQTASSAVSAREHIALSVFDLVILDIKMPGVSGLELMHFALEHGQEAAVVLITAHPDYGDAVTAIKEGAFDYLVKPFTAAQLLEVSRKALTDKGSRPPGQRSSDPAKTAEPLKALLGDSTGMAKLRRLISRIASLDENVVLLGETGTGKGLVARVLHELGRKNRPMVTLDCGAIAAELVESTLFGHEKGSFTGADRKRMGLLEVAEDGTLFLNEVSDFPHHLQSRLLRALQEREFVRVGGTEVERVRARVIAASNRDLQEEVRNGRFREDLYYRLQVIPVTIPPLRERVDDIPLLAEAFLARFQWLNPASKVRKLSAEALRRLAGYPWPGNVRELENVVRRTAALSSGIEILARDLPEDILIAPETQRLTDSGDFSRARAEWLSRFEERYFRDLLERTDGNVVEAARVSGVPRATLYRYLHKYGLDPAHFRHSKPGHRLTRDTQE
jgi:DNA-binding NtrC family response regulator